MRKTNTLTVCLTGGGTAGHVMPHLALLPIMRQRGWRLVYVGSRGIERELATQAGIEFHTIAAGKLRRYLSLRNLTDLFKVAAGFVQSLQLFLRDRPDVVFSKGGFVSVPVALAAWCLRIPVVSHESDLTPGLANRIIARFARRIIYTFAETARFVPADRSTFIGTPVRPELHEGDRGRGAELCGFPGGASVPTILVMGGSQGAQTINDALRAALPELLKTCRVIHLAGKGKTSDFRATGYKCFAYAGKELADLLAAADCVISRAGATAIFEFLALRKPMLLIPLEQGSRGDQIDNAASFTARGWAITLREAELSPTSLVRHARALISHADEMRQAQSTHDTGSVAAKIVDLIGATDPARRAT